jgi:hypothetical protein
VVSVAEENTQVDQVISLGVSIGISPAEQRVGALSQRLAEREPSADTPGTSDVSLPAAALNELKRFTFAL